MDPITVRDVTKSYGQTEALADVTLTLEPGSVHALLGPNGAGKTTLFRVLLGLTRPDEGTASVPATTVGCGFQEPQFYGGLTVEENLGLFRDLTDADDAWVDRLCERCGLERVRHRQAGELSAGFAKRLDLAVAMIDRPDVLLLDEPLADVDAEYRTGLIDFLASYAAADRLVVIATHEVERFESILDTATILDRGRIAWTGSLQAAEAAAAEIYDAVLDDGT